MVELFKWMQFSSEKMLFRFIRLLKFVWYHPLNKKDRLNAIWRVLSWQIVSRITPGPIAIPFVNGTYLLTTKGMNGSTGNWYCGLHEYEDMGFVLHVLQPGDLFVDVGANIGSYSILAGACKGVKVIAIEPVPEPFLWLQKNIKVNKLDSKIESKNIGLADQKSTLQFSSNLDTLNHVVSKKENNNSVISVDVDKLDNILNDKCPTVIKIDVEGYEFQVLNGAKHILDNPNLLAVIIELNGSGIRYGIEDNQIHKLLISKEFEPFKYDPQIRKLISLKGKYRSTSNTLYIRKKNEVDLRILKNTTHKLGTGQRI